MDKEALCGYVDEALAHLGDHAWLADCPLARALLTAGQGDAGAQLSLILSAAMRELRPPQAQQANSPEWRQYRYLLLRYVLGAQPKQIAQELNVSERQARRDHQDALQGLVDLLCQRHSQLRGHDWAHSDGPPPQIALTIDHQVAQRDEAVQAEVARLGAAPSAGVTVVEEAMRGVTDTLANLATSRHLTFEASYGNVPCFVTTDHAVLRQIVLNLLMYLVEHHCDTRIRLSVADRSGSVEIRLEARSPEGEAGLGGQELPCWPTESADRHLAIGGRLLATQGGTLRLYGHNGVPSLVSMSLPAVWIAKVLVIDDNPDFVRLFQRYLGERAYRVYHANTGQKALEMAQEVRPDVITLDVMMPSQDGWEIMGALKCHPITCQIPVIVCSVLQEEALARSLGASEFLLKPVTQSDLLAALERCCVGSPSAGRRE